MQQAKVRFLVSVKTTLIFCLIFACVLFVGVSSHFNLAKAEGGVETEQVSEYIDPNFLDYCGIWNQDESGLAVTELHSVMKLASAESAFGGKYSENFKVNFEMSVVDSTADDASSGFYFRSKSSSDVYKGSYVRALKTKMDIVSMVNGRSTVIGTSNFSKQLTKGEFVKITVSVNNNVVTVSVTDLKNNNLLAKDLSATTALLFNGEANKQRAGFVCEKGLATFRNITMTNLKDNSTFSAAVIGEPVIQETDAFKFFAPSSVDYQVLSVENKPNIDNRDHDVIGQYPSIFYFNYNGEMQDMTIVNKDGTNLDSARYEMKIFYKLPPNWEYLAWAPQSLIGRHGMTAQVIDKNTGCAISRIRTVFRMYEKNLTITGVTAVNRAYDTTTNIELSGGQLVGAISNDNVSFDLGSGSVEVADVGQNKKVKTYIQLKGNDRDQYKLIQPNNITVNITKGVYEVPEAPTWYEVLDTSVTLDTMTGAEFKIEGGKWQKENVFNNLTPGTNYKFYVRMASDANADASESSEALEVATTGSAPIGKTSGCGKSSAMLLSCLSVLGLFLIKRK